MVLLTVPLPLRIGRELDGWVFVELDVGSEGNADGAQIQDVLHRVIASGAIAPYSTSLQGFQFRRLGTGELGLESGVTSSPSLRLDPIEDLLRAVPAQPSQLIRAKAPNISHGPLKLSCEPGQSSCSWLGKGIGCSLPLPCACWAQCPRSPILSVQ